MTKSPRSVPQAFVLVWCPGDGRVVPCEAYRADQAGNAIGNESVESTEAMTAAFAAGRSIITYEGYVDEAAAQKRARGLGALYEVRALPVGSFFHDADNELCVVAPAPSKALPAIPHASDVEKAIVGRLITDLLAAGLSISIWNGGDEPELADSTDAAAIFENLCASDQDELTLRHGDADGAYAGWVRLVWGNDHSVISDYTTRLEPQVKPASDLADDLEEGRAQIVSELVEAVQPVEGARAGVIEALGGALADPESIVDATTRMCIFWQNESARAYAAAQWEYENGALSRTPAAQERAAEFYREVEVRLSQLVGY